MKNLLFIAIAPLILIPAFWPVLISLAVIVLFFGLIIGLIKKLFSSAAEKPTAPD
jgi:hypothetical protein